VNTLWNVTSHGDQNCSRGFFAELIVFGRGKGEWHGGKRSARVVGPYGLRLHSTQLPSPGPVLNLPEELEKGRG
jgi:hypothetical protein